MPHDTDLTDRLSQLLTETAEAFLRTVHEGHRGLSGAAEYEIALAVRRRAIPSPYRS